MMVLVRRHWLWRYVAAESRWRWCYRGDLAAMWCRWCVMLAMVLLSHTDYDATEVPWPWGDVGAKSCWWPCCRVMLAMVLSRWLGHGAMSMVSHAGEGATTGCQGAIVCRLLRCHHRPLGCSHRPSRCCRQPSRCHRRLLRCHRRLPVAEMPPPTVKKVLIARGVDHGGHLSRRNGSPRRPQGGCQLSWFVTMI
jgi:hypothetical protein